MIRTTVDLSGFGGGYEQCCQKMLWNGIEAVEKDPKFAEKAFQQMHSHKNVFGLVTSDGVEAGQLDDAIMEGVEDATGAMHHQVISVLLYILKNGRDKWLDWTRSNQPDRIFEWDGTEKSCPKPDLISPPESSRNP